MKKLFIATAMAAALTGCSCQKTTMKDAMTHEWNIDKIDGQALDNKGEKTPFIGLDVEKSRVYGNASCNSLTGGFKAEGDAKKGTIDLSQMGITRMMCPDMSTETKILEALSRVKKYRFTKSGSLILTDDNDKAVIEMSVRN